MDSKYPNLVRPPRKLRYFPSQECASTRPKGRAVALEDSDGWFDDLDSASDVDQLALSPLRKTCPSPVKEEEVQRGTSTCPEQPHSTGKHPRPRAVPKGDDVHTEGRAASPLMENVAEMESPFKEHRPMKTSSPIERVVDVEAGGRDRDRTASPMLFCDDDDDDDDGQGPLKSEPVPTQKPQCNGSSDIELESPPNKFKLGKPKTPAHRSREEVPCTETDPAPEEPISKSPSPAPEPIGKQTLQGRAGLPVSKGKRDTQPRPPAKEPRPHPPAKEPRLLPPTKEPRTHPPAKEPTTHPPAKEPRPHPPAKEPRLLPPTKEPRTHPPAKEPTTHPPAKKPRPHPPTEEPRPHPPTEEPRPHPPTEEPRTHPPVKEPRTHPPAKEPRTHPPAKEPRPHPPTEEPRLKQVEEVKSAGDWVATSAFLQKLRDAEQSKPVHPKKTPSLVREPPDLELEDDFLFLEDEPLCWFTIPRKKDPNKSKPWQKQGKAQSSGISNKEVAADMSTKGNQPEKAKAKQTPGGGKESRATEQPHTVEPKTKGKKGKEANGGTSHIPVDIIEQDKQHTKEKRPNKVSSNPTVSVDMGQEEPGENAKIKSGKSKSSTKTKKKASKSSQVSKAGMKGDEENPKKGPGRPVKAPRVELLEEPAPVADQREVPGSEEHGGAAHLLSPFCDQVEQDIPSTAEDLKQKLVKGQGKATSKDPASHRPKETKTPSVGESDPSQESQVPGKRKRTKPGSWWLGGSEGAMETVAENIPILKKSKQTHRKKSEPAVPSSVKAGQDGQSVTSSTQPAELKPEKHRRGRPKKQPTASREEPEKQPAQTEEEGQLGTVDQEQGQLSPLLCPLRQHTFTPGEKVYSHTPNGRLPNTLHPSKPSRPHDHAKTPFLEKRSRNCPGNWWEINKAPENMESNILPPRKPHSKIPKPRKGEGAQPKPRESLLLGTPNNSNSACSSKPGGGAPQPLLKRKDLSAPKTIKRSLATFGAIFTSGKTAVPEAKIRSVSHSGGRKTLFPSQEEPSAQSSNMSEHPADNTGQELVSDCILFDKSASTVDMEPAVGLGKKLTSYLNDKEISQGNNRLSDNMLKGFKSGPSSMIELENFDDEEDLSLPSSRVVQPVLVDTEFCGPPLRPLALQVEDTANLVEWLRLLWPSTIKNGGQITPDQFQWYSYRGRVLGVKMDLQCDTFYNGKILLGSFMKKPLQVDHSATSVYNVLTGCVSVTIDGKKSHYNPGQTFMIPCGHAYDILNRTREPAVLFFTRMLSESPN